MGIDTYLANVDVGDVGRPGAPVLHVAALVVASTGLISGHAEITQAVAPPDDAIVISNMTGRIRSLGFGHGVRVVSLRGTYTRSFPPPAIGEVELKFSADLVVAPEGDWVGVGSFSYGAQEIDDVPVKPAIHSDSDSG